MLFPLSPVEKQSYCRLWSMEKIVIELVHTLMRLKTDILALIYHLGYDESINREALSNMG